MQKILENFNKPTVGRNCLWASIESVFNYMNIMLLEHEIYFICGGMNIKYTSNGILGYGSILQNLKNSNLDKIVDICNCSCPVSFKEIFDTLSENTPIICIIQANNMKFHKECSKITHSRRHAVVLYGLNTKTGESYISDRYYIDVLGKYHVFFEPVQIDDFLPYICEAFNFNLKTDANMMFNYKNLLNEAIDSYISPKVETEKTYGNIAWINYFDFILNTYIEDKKTFIDKAMELSFLIENVLIIPSLEYIVCLIEENLKEYPNAKACVSEITNIANEWSIFSLDVMRRCFRGNKASCMELSDMNKEIIEKQIKVLKLIREKL